MTKKIDIIQVPEGTVPKLMAIFGCSKPTVHRALRYSTSTLGAQIRDKALKDFGGIETKKTIFV